MKNLKILILAGFIFGGVNFVTTHAVEQESNQEKVFPLHEIIKNQSYTTDQKLHMMKKLLDQKQVDVNAQDVDGKTALNLAIFYNIDPKIIELLINYNANVNDNSEMLRLAVEYDNFAITKLLLDHGANVNVNEGFLTPLHSAIQYDEMNKKKSNQFAIIQLLINHGANINAQDYNGETPLYYAYELSYQNLNSLDIQLFLLNHGAKIDIENNQGQTVLFNAIMLAGVANDQRNNHDKLSLSANFFKSFKLLLDHNPNVNIQNKLGRTPLDIAILTNNVQAVQLLLNHGANVNSKVVCTMDDCINESIHEKFDQEGFTPLHYAAQEKDLKIIELLLAAGANANAINDTGQTPDQLTTNPKIIAIIQKAQNKSKTKAFHKKKLKEPFKIKKAKGQ